MLRKSIEKNNKGIDFAKPIQHLPCHCRVSPVKIGSSCSHQELFVDWYPKLDAKSRVNSLKFMESYQASLRTTPILTAVCTPRLYGWKKSSICFDRAPIIFPFKLISQKMKAKTDRLKHMIQ